LNGLENCYNIVENKTKQTNKKETIEEVNENEYLKAELEYSKKLRAVVQAKKNQQQKKK